MNTGNTNTKKDSMTNTDATMNADTPRCIDCRGYLVGPGAPPIGGVPVPREHRPGSAWCPSCNAWKPVERSGSYLGYAVEVSD